MNKSKLLLLLQYFSEEEKNAFPLFLNSPYWVGTGATEMLRLYQHLSARLEKSQPNGIEKKQLHQAVYPDKPFSEARIERAFSRLSQLTLDFLRIQQYREAGNRPQQMLDLVQLFREKKLVPFFEKNLIKTRKALALEPTNADKHLLNYKISTHEHDWKSEFNQLRDDLSIEETIQHLDAFYLLKRTELLNRFWLQQKIITLPVPDILQFEFASSDLTAHYESMDPLLLIHRKILELLQKAEPDKDGVETLMGLITQHESGFSEDTLKELYTYLRNYCALLIDAGNSSFYKTLHAIQQDNLAKGYFYYNGKIPPHAFTSINTIALAANQTSWARQFIENHRHKIVALTDSEDLYRMNLSICFFAEKQYEEALSNLPFNIAFPNYFHFVRRLELKIYYELQSELLMHKIDAFRKYVARTDPRSISENHREMNLQFLNLLLQLSQSKPRDPKRSLQLVKRIKEKKKIADRTWLLEKAYELA